VASGKVLPVSETSISAKRKKPRDKPADLVSVVYDGVFPDTLKDQPGAEVVAEGEYNGEGTFSAHTLITRCPGKHEADR
jgi:cytochrome c-type biogenesis protein CcmE